MGTGWALCRNDRDVGRVFAFAGFGDRDTGWGREPHTGRGAGAGASAVSLQTPTVSIARVAGAQAPTFNQVGDMTLATAPVLRRDNITVPQGVIRVQVTVPVPGPLQFDHPDPDPHPGFHGSASGRVFLLRWRRHGTVLSRRLFRDPAASSRHSRRDLPGSVTAHDPGQQLSSGVHISDPGRLLLPRDCDERPLYHLAPGCTSRAGSSTLISSHPTSPARPDGPPQMGSRFRPGCRCHRRILPTRYRPS